MANYNEIELKTYTELQPVFDKYNKLLTPKQIDTLIKFISTDYNNRRIPFRQDDARYGGIVMYDFNRFLALKYLNQLLEILGQNTPISLVEDERSCISVITSIISLKCYFEEGSWLDELKNFVQKNRSKTFNFAEKGLQDSNKRFTKALQSQQTRLESIRETIELAKIQLKEARKGDDTKPLHNRKRRRSFDDGDDHDVDDRLQEELERLISSEHLCETNLKDYKAKLMEVRTELKPILKAKAKIASLEFNIFSPTIIQKKDKDMDGDGGDEVPEELLVDTTDIFTTDEIFPDREDVLIWTKSVGKENGIIIVTIRSDTATGKRGRKDKLIMGCERGGKYKSKLQDSHALTHERTCSRLIKCPFMLRSRPLVTGEGWIVSVRCGTHNHPLADSLSTHCYLNRLTKKEREYVNEQTKYGMKPRFILAALKDKNKDSLTIPSQIYKARSSYRSNLRGDYTEIQHLLKLIHDEKYLYWISRRKDPDVLENIFWTDPDCVKLLNMFPSVLILDSTYKTNKYRLPLLEIVGSTSTELTFSVGFAYLEHEKKENFV